MSTLRTQFERALSARARAPIGVHASPVERWDVDGCSLWVKRDDLNADVCGGNKARALQFLLGDVRPGTGLVTVGGEGSTHVLATARHGAMLGLTTRAYRWRHAMNPVARLVSDAIGVHCVAAPIARSPALAFAAASWRRVTTRDHWIPFGGTSACGMLGHVEAALELADQVSAGQLPSPERVYVAFGTGGTAAGLALGLALADLRTTVVAVRCGPSLGHERWWLHRLATRAARAASLPVALARRAALSVDHSAYAGAYGRPLPEAVALAARVSKARGVLLDDTYAAKACYAAARSGSPAGAPVLFWHTFDARWMP
jgi:D-cysteine desulfhydrase